MSAPKVTRIPQGQGRLQRGAQHLSIGAVIKCIFNGVISTERKGPPLKVKAKLGEIVIGMGQNQGRLVWEITKRSDEKTRRKF